MLTPSRYLISMLEPDSAAAEAYRILRTNISLRDFDKKIKVINVISAIQSESKSTTIINLAYVYSQLGIKVLLIDLDLRAPSIHRKLLVRNKVGITDVVGGRIAYDEAVIHYTDNLDILLSGTKIPFATEFIESSNFKKFLDTKREEYDIILIDCPPLNLVADSIIASALCDGTLLCIASGKNDRKELLRAKDALEYTDVNVLGIVMTCVKDSSKYNHYYSYASGKKYYGSYGSRKKK